MRKKSLKHVDKPCAYIARSRNKSKQQRGQRKAADNFKKKGEEIQALHRFMTGKSDQL